METIKEPMVEYGLAKRTHVGGGESGDLHVVCCNQNGILIAVIDGIGHGEEAAEAARTAGALLQSSMDEPVISLMERCHERLRGTRGAVLSVAFISPEQKMMTWIGVGNVQGVLVRANGASANAQEPLLLRAGVVGSILPALQASVLPVSRGDTVFFASDGIQSDFSTSLSGRENPQRAADRILSLYRSGNDDALVLVARLTGINP
ncbi:MAG TPA: SpoIIE family protein phosphatase [Candidatus Sulfotelmatobacter sp.]|nr:SpoIIE family protein phosphatase [Candidatus Sulfotelmatobacter sp.]